MNIGDSDYNDLKGETWIIRHNKEMKEGVIYPPDPTEYNLEMKEQGIALKVQEAINQISILESSIISDKTPRNVMNIMDLIERAIKTCGGESKAIFTEVWRDFIKVKTRVPLTANIFPFKPDGEDNPRFHKVVTKILLLIPEIEGIRWLPTDDRQSNLLIIIKRAE